MKTPDTPHPTTTRRQVLVTAGAGLGAAAASILQIGVGFYHALNGNHKGAVLLLTDGIEKTSGFTPTALGVDTGKLVDEAQRCLEVIHELPPDQLDRFDPGTIPTIEVDTGEGR